MLTIYVGQVEHFDEEKSEFFKQGGFLLELEHSLVSLSKWESIHQKPFLSKEDKTREEILSYIECMVQTENPPEDFLDQLSDEDFDEINTYINSKQSATWFGAEPKSMSRETITSELIYYWMVSYEIPFEVQYWHLNRLFVLLRVFNAKNSKEKKMSPNEIAARNRELNEQRKKQFGTRG